MNNKENKDMLLAWYLGANHIKKTYKKEVYIKANSGFALYRFKQFDRLSKKIEKLGRKGVYQTPFRRELKKSLEKRRDKTLQKAWQSVIKILSFRGIANQQIHGALCKTVQAHDAYHGAVRAHDIVQKKSQKLGFSICPAINQKFLDKKKDALYASFDDLLKAARLHLGQEYSKADCKDYALLKSSMVKTTAVAKRSVEYNPNAFSAAKQVCL